MREKVFPGTSAPPFVSTGQKRGGVFPSKSSGDPGPLSRAACHPALAQCRLPHTQSCRKAEALIRSKGRMVPTLLSQRDLSVCLAVSRLPPLSATVPLETGRADEGR